MFEREPTKEELIIICSHRLKELDYFDKAFSFIINKKEQVYYLKKVVFDNLKKKKIFFQGRPVEINEVNIKLNLYLEYGSYNS